jgi:hypothetical protein
MSGVNRILDRLAGVKQTGPGRWMAKCPAHEDRTPSLSIRETEDGRILINDFGGCGSIEVMAAIDLKLSDLFEKPLQHYLAPFRVSGFSARELMTLTANETTVASLLANYAQTRQLTPDEMRRLEQAAGRLEKARAMINGG